MKESKFISKLIDTIINFRIVVICILLLGFIFAAFQIPKIKIDNSLDVWFVENDPVLLDYKYFQKQFGNDEIVAVVFSDPESILTPENDKLIQSLTSEIEQLPRIKGVYSIANTLDQKHFLSKDQKTTILQIELQSIENIDEERNEILKDVKDVLDKHFQPLNKKYHLAGIGVVYNTLNQISLKDSNLFISLSYLLIFLILSLFIRRIKYILLAFFIILYSVIFTMGLFSFAGKSINMVTLVLPTLIMMFGVADVIHIVNHYFRDAGKFSNLPKKELIIKSISSITLPCFLTSLTTGVGFASLIITKMQVIRDLGIFASIGIMLAFFLSIIISSIAFSFFAVPSSQKIGKRDSKFLYSITEFIFSKKKIILVSSLFVFVVFLLGVFKVRVDTYSIQFLKPNHPVRQDSDFIETNFGFYTPIEFTLKAEDDLLSPQNLGKVAKFQKIIEEDSLVEGACSVIDFLPNLAVLESKEQVLEIFQHIPEEDLRRFVNSDYSVLRITGRVKMLSARGFKEIIDRVMKKKDDLFDKEIHVQANGYLPLYVKMMEYIMKTQVGSFSLAFLIVFIIIAFYAGSVRLGLFAVLPNLFPLAVTLGIMGWLGIRLDIATVTITAIAIGVVVDDTMHFLYKFKRESSESNIENALRTTIQEVGWPIISTSVILILGFAVLALAQVNSIRYFGILSVIVIVSALFGDLFILPSLIFTLRKKR